METTAQAHDKVIKPIASKVDCYGMAQTSLEGEVDAQWTFASQVEKYENTNISFSKL